MASVVSKITRPVAGLLIAFFCTVVKLVNWMPVGVDCPVPPLAVGKMPLTSAVKLALFFAANVPSSARGARSSTLVGVGTGGARSAKVMLAAKPS